MKNSTSPLLHEERGYGEEEEEEESKPADGKEEVDFPSKGEECVVLISSDYSRPIVAERDERCSAQESDEEDWERIEREDGVDVVEVE